MWKLYLMLTLDITFMGRDHDLKWLAFSLYPLFIFPFQKDTLNLHDNPVKNNSHIFFDVWCVCGFPCIFGNVIYFPFPTRLRWEFRETQGFGIFQDRKYVSFIFKYPKLNLIREKTHFWEFNFAVFVKLVWML